ncbi:hypothetical protein [Serratia nematodiphila]|uniref:hypothetical protein n=1 Tax=Serratia nematodiphila TaxID=458197 RepID=UPI0011D7FCD4|nr:hypothetical protein [Serratia nematodiphila]TXE60099.1 hypothetical protein FOT58_17640 [Serratia nematodiphila]
MSSENKDTKGKKENKESNYKNIDLEAFAKYLNTLKSSHECPMCTNTKWTLYTPGDTANSDDSPIVVPSIPGVTVDVPSQDKRLYTNTTFTLLVMSCNNCGYLHLFSLPRVNKNIVTGDYKKISCEDNPEEDDL